MEKDVLLTGVMIDKRLFKMAPVWIVQITIEEVVMGTSVGHPDVL